MDPLLLAHYTTFLKPVLTPDRYRHSLGVMQVMEDLAGVYGLDREQAALAGLLHDAAKDLPPDEQRRIIQEAALEIESLNDLNYKLYLHAPVGAVFVRQALGIQDPLVLDAIRLHTYHGEGENFHSPFVWCLRFSDVLEPNRNWANVPWIRTGRDRLDRLVHEGRLKEAAFLQTGWVIRMFEGNHFPVHANLHRVYRELSQELSLDAAFLD